MKEITLETLPAGVEPLLVAAQNERIVITKQGKPVAVVLGIEDQDEEDWELQLSPEFWKMIEERRHEPTIPLEAVRAELLKDS